MPKPINGYGEHAFSETESEHGDRLGSFHRARMLRRAILEKLNNVTYSDVPEIMRMTSLEGLMGEAAVTLESDGLLTPTKVSTIAYLDNFTRKLFASNYQDVGEKTMTRVSNGLTPSKPPYPYTLDCDGRTLCLDSRDREVIKQAFDYLTGFGTYTGVADLFNEQGFLTSTGRTWNKDSARTFMQHPIHAGYTQSFERGTGGVANKRGPLTLYPHPIKDGPAVSFDGWMTANPVMADRKITIHS